MQGANSLFRHHQVLGLPDCCAYWSNIQCLDQLRLQQVQSSCTHEREISDVFMCVCDVRLQFLLCMRVRVARMSGTTHPYPHQGIPMSGGRPHPLINPGASGLLDLNVRYLGGGQCNTACV